MTRSWCEACLVLAAVCLAGCGVSMSGNGAGGTLPSGRSVDVTSDRAFRTINCGLCGRDTSLVTLGTFTPRHVRIAPTTIEMDGTRVATIAASTKSVSVAEQSGRLVICADGAPVFNTKF